MQRRRGRRLLVALVLLAGVAAGLAGAAAFLGRDGGAGLDATGPTSSAPAEGSPIGATSSPVADGAASTAPTTGEPAEPTGTAEDPDDASSSATDPAGEEPTSGPPTPRSAFLAASDSLGDLDLYRHEPDGSVAVILDRSVNDYAPSLSPDGSRVAFESNAGGTRAVYVVPVDGGSEPRQLSPEGAEAAEPAWSPQGDRIAWASRARGSWDIVVHDLDTATEIFVVTGTSDDRSPSWSPDGTSLVFRSDRTGNGDIYQLDLESQELRRVTTEAAEEGNPAVSPGGSIAYERRVGDDIEVFTIAPGGEPERRTTHAGFDGSPAFDGEQLLFVRRDAASSSIVLDHGGEAVVIHTSAGLIRDLRVD